MVTTKREGCMTIKSNTPAHDKDCWQTPLWLFDALDIEFGFWLDSAASDKNALCAHWLTEADDALNSEWVGQVNGQNYGLIFDGDIRFTVTGKDNITDSWVLIQAIGDHEAFLYATTITTLAAGYTVADLHRATMQDFNAFGVTQGITGDFPDTVFPRGRAIYSSTRNVMDNIAAQCKATWQLVDGQVQMVPDDKYIHEAILLNADTGLIGMPQQTMGGGVNVRCLINPNIRINGLIQLDQASVYRAALGNSEIAQSPGRITETEENGNRVLTGTTSQAASIATDGVYIVKAIDYTGDTRGQAWYMDLMCFARGARDLISQATIARSGGG